MTEYIDEHAVVIAGGGPTGLMLAGEMTLAGIDVALVERRESQALAGARAGGVSARTLEVLDQRGIVDRFLAEGQIAQVTGVAMTRLDICDFPTRHNHGLALWQKHFERILAGWLHELGVTIYRSRDVVGFAQDDAGVDTQLSDGHTLRAQYLVGCDGGRSTIRKAAGIDFPGWDATTSLLAEVEMQQMPPYGVHHSPLGTFAFGREEYEIRDGAVVYTDIGLIRVMLTEPHAGSTDEPTLQMEQPRKHVAAMMSGLGIHYDLGARHPLLGRRMPDLDLVTSSGPRRVFTLLHGARPVLINFGAPHGVDITPWLDRVLLIDASYDGVWELPAIGAVTAPTAVLIRPDGYVAWVGEHTQTGLSEALATWFGPPVSQTRSTKLVESIVSQLDEERRSLTSRGFGTLFAFMMSPDHCPAGGCQSSTLFPSGSMTHAKIPYSESSIFSSTLQPSSRRTVTSAWRSATR